MFPNFRILLTFGVIFIQCTSGAAIQRKDGPARSGDGNRYKNHSSRHHHSYTQKATSTKNSTGKPGHLPSGTGIIETFSPSSVVTIVTTASATSRFTGDDGHDKFPSSTSTFPEGALTPPDSPTGDSKSTRILAGEETTSTTAEGSSLTASSMTLTVEPLSTNSAVSLSSTSPPAPESTTTSASASAEPASYWQPSTGATWQIQLTDSVDLTNPASIFDIDLFDNEAATISALHANNQRVICYFSAGTYEDWRPDATSFQATDKGAAMDGWAGEWWLDTNSDNVRSIMTARIELARVKGCDGVDPDNVDAYNNANGVTGGLTEANAVDYMTFLADAAHSRGLSIGLKNAAELVEQTLDIMEWQVNEQCVQFEECNLFQPFVDAGKPVFHIEYPDDAPDVATDVKSQDCGVSGFSSVMKKLALDAWVDPCQ
ncbi:hypothetical protein LSUE1_G007915 [Lachnellula suecica]|uniref:alpha-galactosidase n=1 Tax=Lachnellula suecica TaxID=602035 RepID=A0A8T9CBK6_9HELO|nr:hypothetical protein LSUE1_G007915 [Lachnellula suecica]